MDLAAPQGAVTPSIAATASGLAAAAADSLGEIRAIARYVQGLNYVAVAYNIGRGWCYRPHDATTVLRAGYGDCKDKANLMRAMLAVLGIESYPVAIYLGDPARVRADWPSPQQFNHAIVAVGLKDELRAPAVGSHPGAGRLLFFDPTDPHTPLGLLPQDEEDSLALLVIE